MRREPIGGRVLWNRLERHRLGDREASAAGTPELRQVGAATDLLTHVVGYRAQIRSGGDARTETGAIPGLTVICSSAS